MMIFHGMNVNDFESCDYYNFTFIFIVIVLYFIFRLLHIMKTIKLIIT